MSAVCAILRLDGRDAARETLAPVLAGLTARGPDGADVAADGPVALGHTLNATTPEALVEHMPLRHAGTGCLISADVRLDNRETLIAALGLAQAGRVIGDGELILEAYLKWGLDCPAHLAGDFAFVIWDPRHQRLFAARDKVGMRQLVYYHRPGQVFACATDAEALVRHPDVPARINEGRIADLIQYCEAIDGVSTFYQDLWQLPPAHGLTVDRDGQRTWRYWQLEPQGIVERANDRAYEEAFLEVFTEAVRVRLRAPEGVLGSMLSGGMDSGSVVAVASRLLQQAGAPPLKTLSAIDTDPDCLETRAIRTALTMEHLDPTLIPLDMPEELRDTLINMVRQRAEPFDGHMAPIWAVYIAARRNGLKVVLDGLAGDTTLGMGNVVNWHLEAGRYAAAWREAKADEACWGSLLPARQQMLALMRRKYAPAGLRNLWLRLKPRLVDAEPYRPWLLRDDFAERIHYPERLARWREHCANGNACDAATSIKRMLHPYTIAGRERYDRVAGTFGIEARDPFFDPKLFEFTLTLPVEQVKSRGWFKYILRRAMAGYLPDEVRWRTGRTHVGRRFVLHCTPTKSPEDRAIFREVLSPYVDPTRLEEWLARDDADSALAQVSELRYLANWLLKVKGRSAA
jgi:asparagine synthase (glutamine-hydrolysing)